VLATLHHDSVQKPHIPLISCVLGNLFSTYMLLCMTEFVHEHHAFSPSIGRTTFSEHLCVDFSRSVDGRRLHSYKEETSVYRYAMLYHFDKF
jgi:hypothetical protein